jgi:nitroreductase
MAIRKYIKKTKKRLDLLFLPIFSSSRILASVYYFLFSRDFGREQQATLKGRLKYHKSLQRLDGSSPLLRRNVHRLEKGLIMKPRRETFALDYIDETVACYLMAVNEGSISDQELKWARDVIREYFRVVDTVELAALREVFFADSSVSEVSNYLPYSSSDSQNSDVSYQQLRQLFLQRRSRRWFQQDEVDSELIDKAISMASLAPSACNRQPYYFKVFNDREKIKGVSKLAMGTSGFHHNIPCLLAVIGDLSAYPEERDRHVIYIDAGLASMQLMLAVETMGLGSCPINWPDVEKRERKISKAISLKSHEKVIMLIAVGKPDPDGGIPFSQKKGVELLKDEWVDL